MPLNGQFLDKSGLTYLWSKLKTKLAAKQDTISDLSTIRSGAAAGATAVQPAEFEADQDRQEVEIGSVANAGAKNLLKITASSQTIKGVTFTVNGDQTVTVNGTNDGTGASTFVIVPNAQAIKIPDGSYILSGCPAGGGVPFDLRWYMYSPGKSAYDYGNGASIEKSGNTASSNIAIVVKTGQTANNLVFKPMLLRAEITDDTFVPYAPTNRELYETKTEQTETNVIANLGAKNLFNISATPTVNHTDYTLTDGKLTVGANGNWAHYSVSIDLPAGDYILSMIISDYNKTSEAPDTSMRLRMSSTTSGGSNVVLQTIAGNGTISVPFTWTGGALYLQFYPNYNGTSYANRFSAEDVMIRQASITDDTFVPYAPTNRELYETCKTKVTMQQAYGDAIQILANSNLNDYTIPGIYYALIATTSTIKNTPYTATGFRVVVEKNTPSGAAVFQTIYPTSRSHLEFYRRIYEGGSWSSWYKFEGTASS